jgi:hypothetical protein
MLLSAILTLSSASAFATGDFLCADAEGDGDVSLYAVVSWSFGNAIVGKPKFRYAAGEETEITVSQYWNDERELRLLSVMDDASSPVFRQREIALKARRTGDALKGTITVSYAGEGNKIPPRTIPVVCERQ